MFQLCITVYWFIEDNRHTTQSPKCIWWIYFCRNYIPKIFPIKQCFSYCTMYLFDIEMCAKLITHCGIDVKQIRIWSFKTLISHVGFFLTMNAFRESTNYIFRHFEHNYILLTLNFVSLASSCKTLWYCSVLLEPFFVSKFASKQIRKIYYFAYIFESKTG